MEKVVKKLYFHFVSVLLVFLILFFIIDEVGGQSCSFNKDYAYKAPNSPAVYYITENCTKRAFTRADIFFTYFPSWSNVQSAPALALQLIPNDPLGFMPYGPLYDPKYGALVKIVADPKVYLLLGEEKYWITSEEVFLALGYKWNWIEDVDTRLLDNYTTGNEITDKARHPNFTLITYSGSPNVYRLETGFDGKTTKRRIVDEEVFEKLGFRLDRIVTVSPNEMYPDGTPLTKDDIEAIPIKTSEPHAGNQQIACEHDANPVFSHAIVDSEFIETIVPPPNIHRMSGDLKTHSYIHTTNVGISIYAPVDMELFRGTHYIGGPYSLDFRVSCEVMLRIAHIDPIEKIKAALPKKSAADSKTVELAEPIEFKAGDLIAYVYKDTGVLSTGLDFGVYNSTKPNRYATERESEIYTTAVCPYEYFSDSFEKQYRDKFDLIEQQGMIKDGPSFCSIDIL